MALWMSVDNNFKSLGKGPTKRLLRSSLSLSTPRKASRPAYRQTHTAYA